MPDFKGLNPIIAPEVPREDKSVYNPAAVIPKPIDTGGGIPDVNGLDLLNYYSSNSTFNSTDVIYPASELVENKRYGIYNPTVQDQEDYHAQGQSGWARAGNATWNFVNKFGAYVTQNAGFILGAAPAAIGGIANLGNEALGGEGKLVNDGNAISLMTDNWMVNLGDVWKEKVQETNPIYKTDTYTNGNIWNKLGTTSWWLDDAVDRLALTAAMFVPGIAEAKGFGLFGAAIDAETGMLRATGIGAKGIQAIAENPGMYSRLGKLLGNQIYKTAATGVVDLETATALKFKDLISAAQRAELYTWNVVGQSALNGRESQVGIRKALTEQRDKGLISMSDEDIENKAAEAAMKGFGYTVPLSLAGSLYELPQIFSTAKGVESSLKKFFNVNTLEQLEGAALSSKPGLATLLGKTLLTGLEHGQNESMQVAVGRYLEDSIAGKEKDGKVIKDQGGFGSILYDWLDNVNDPNGQNNIALGTIQGMLMTLGGRAYKGITKEYAKEEARNQNFITGINQAIARRRYFASPDDMFEKDANGTIVTVTDNQGNIHPKVKQDTLAALGMSMIDSHAEVLAKIQAAKEGNQLALDQLNFNSLAALSQSFLSDPSGVEYLGNLLRFEAKNQKEDVNRTNDIQNGVEVTPDIQLQKNLEYVADLKKSYDAIDNRHGGFTLLNVDKNNEGETALAAKYINDVKNYQYFLGADQIFLNKQLAKNNMELASLGAIERVEEPSSPEEERINRLFDENEEIADGINVTKDAYKNSIDKTQFKETFNTLKEKLAKEVAERKIKEEAKKTEVAPEEQTEKKKTVKVKTKDGEEELEIGTEYYLGRTVQKDKYGRDVYGAPKLTILGEAENGMINIKDSNGNERLISKAELADYKLGKVSDTDSNKKAKFFLDNWNTSFTHYGIKVNGKPAVGRLEYSSKEGKLDFVYKNAKGVVQRTEVTGQNFVAKEGYIHAMLESKETLTAAQKQSLDAFTAEKDLRTSAKYEARLKIINDMFDSIEEKLNSTKELITEKNTQLDKIVNELSDLQEKIKSGEFTKKNNFKVSTSKAIANAMKLSRMQDQLTKEITALEEEKDNLENTQSSILDMIDDLENSPVEGVDFLNQLKEQRGDIQSLILETGLSINSLAKLLDSTQDATDAAIDYVRDLISQFEKMYPKTEAAITGLTSADATSWLDFLKNNPNFLKLRPDFVEDLAATEDEIARIEDLVIVPNDKKVAELKTQLEDLQKQLKSTEKQLTAKEAILNKFQEIADQYKKQQAEEAALAQKQALMKQFLGTNTNDVQANVDEEIDPKNRNYQAEPKKDKLAVIGGTIPINEGKAHQIRANSFGYRFNSMPNKDAIRGMIITSKTEADLIPGLAQHLVLGTNAIPSTVIALVMVQDNADGTVTLVDEFGKPIEGNANLVDKAIYQVFPTEKLTANYGKGTETMFRDDVSEEERKSLTEQYTQWRKDQLARTTLAQSEGITAVFGIPEYIQKMEGDKSVTDHDARSTAEEAGLVNKDMLVEDRVVTVATTNDFVSNGSVTFKTPLGRVFLKVPGGMVKLFSSKFTAEKATTIYDVIHELSKTVDTEDGIKGDKATKLINWLKSTVYWGIAKDRQTNQRKPGGYNNIWFEEVNEKGKSVTKLFMSGKGEGFYFTPATIEANKENIIALLQGMYHNTNATMVNDDSFRNPYFEITGIDKNGEPTVKRWQNYQTYLLSSEGRSIDEVPLKTKLQPITQTKPVNRTGIYFTLNSTVDSYQLNATKPVVTQTAVPKAPATQQQTPAPETEAEEILPIGTYKLNGKAINTLSLGTFGSITFKLDGKLFNETNGQKGFTLPEWGVDLPLVKNLMEAKGYDEDKAKSVIGASILAAMKDKLEAMKIPDTAPVEELTEVDEDEWNDFPSEPIDNKAYRLQVTNQVGTFPTEKWSKVEAWLKENFSGIPVYRVKNIIDATNGQQAWGMFKDGAIYIYENAEVGTAYHEVFHAVWRMFSNANERKNVEADFRARSGSFKTILEEEIKYSEATSDQLEERLAEEFRNFVHFGEEPPRASKEGKSWIRSLFDDLVNFIKKVLLKQTTTTKQLFDKINSGKYNKYIPQEAGLSYAQKGLIDIENANGKDGVFKIAEIPPTQVHEMMQEMTYTMLTDITNNNKSLFNIPKLNKTEIYDGLQNRLRGNLKAMGDTIAKEITDGKRTVADAAGDLSNIKFLFKQVKEQWDDIVEKHQKEYLKQYSIQFDENNNLILNDQDKSGKADWQDARKIDALKRANSAIKILTATVARTIPGEFGPVRKLSAIGGSMLVPSDQVNITLFNKLSNATSIEDMFAKLKDLAINNPDYVALYERLTKGTITDKTIDFSKMNNTYDLQLMGAFWNTYKKANPDVRNVFILASGEVEIGDANLSSAARQFKTDMLYSLIGNIKSKNPYVIYDPVAKTYSATTTKVILNPKHIESYIDFLKQLGIEFTPAEIRKLSDNQRGIFRDAVQGIRTSIAAISDVSALNTRTINLEGQLLKLGALKALIQNPDFESTYFNISGERVQTYIGTNLLTDMYDNISKLLNVNDLNNTSFKYLLTDAFTKGSVVLKSIFNGGIDGAGTGKRISGTEEILHTAYAGGIIDESTGKKKEASQVTYKERLIQELNMNADGYFMNLVPGDASIEHMIRLHLKNSPFITTESLSYGYDDVNNIFRDYFISEVALARENRPIVKLSDKDVKAGKVQRESGDLRFFKSILGDKLHSEITSEKNKNKTAEELFDSKEFNKQIKDAIKDFVEEETKELREILEQYDIISYGPEGVEVESLYFSNNKDLTDGFIDKELKALSVNYMIANIELHKIVYSDPYQYSDALKRIKNFNSPRQSLISGSPEFNTALDKVFNKGLKPGDIGYYDFTKDYLRTVTLADIFHANELPGYEDRFEETDGGGYIILAAARAFRLHAGDWFDTHEAQYQHDVAYEKLVKSGASKEEIAKLERKNPGVVSTYTPIKPITSGSKADGQSYNDVVLDKFALAPLSFRVVHLLKPDSDAVKFVDKMTKQGMDYGVYKSGRKVGTTVQHVLYDENGNFNTADFPTPNNIPFAIIGIQSEVPSKTENLVTQGSQMTKLATLDFMEAGVPVDFKTGGDINQKYAEWLALTLDQKLDASPLYKEILNNQKLLEAKIDNGISTMLKKLGIKKVPGGYEFNGQEGVDKLVDTLTDEILKREVNDNIKAAFEGFKKGQVILEATPSYQQIRNILYSIADKNITSQKISGSLKVQIPSTMLFSVNRTKINGKDAFTSDELKFYSMEENGKTINVCELGISRWFNSSMSDQELMDYLNNTDEGKAILSGIAYRIPTQKQNSIDVFKIGKILPKEFNDSVVIPSALVKKVGSDFDIDKLSIYLKSVYTDSKGEIKLIPEYASREEADTAAEDVFYDILQGKIDKTQAEKEKFGRLQSLLGNILLNKTTEKTAEKWIPIFKNMFGEDDSAVDVEESIMTRLESIGKDLKELTDADIQEAYFQEFKDEYYKKSLDNAYIDSLQKLISHPLNYQNLIKPNDASQLKDLSKEITDLLGETPIDYTSVGTMLNRKAMTELRHDFVSGKYAIGIAATAQTNLAQSQRAYISIDKERMDQEGVINPVDKKWLGDGNVNFEKYNSLTVNGKTSPTLSLITNKAGQNISDIVGQFIDGYVDISKDAWVMRMGATPNIAGTWLFLTKLGVPIDTVGYFMNQPIVRDYLRSIEKAGYKYLFMDKFVNDMLDVYSPKVKNIEQSKEFQDISKIPSNTVLKEMMGKKTEALNDVQKNQQQFILNEFLKYAKMAEHLFYVQQGSNFDTATINDPYLITKKRAQLAKARNTIISSVDDLLEASHIDFLKNTLYDVRDAFADTVLMSDRANVRNVVEGVLMDYTDLPDRDFVKLSQKAVNTLFDWAVQTDRNINLSIQNILLGTDSVKSAADQIIEFQQEVLNDKKHPLYDNLIINSLKKKPGGKENTPNNLYIAGRDNKVYDQNQIIYAFNELKQNLKGDNRNLYGKLVRLAVIQSGLTNSPIAFTNLLPYEEFVEIYNETLSKLENMPNLADFNRLNVFERNNWSDSDVVPFAKAKFIKTKAGKWMYDMNRQFLDKALVDAMENGNIPDVIKVSPFTKEGRSEFMTYSWEDYLSKEDKAAKRAKGDTSYIHKGLFKKVYGDDGKPIIVTSESKAGVIYTNYLYKEMNAWGDSFRANEFYEKLNPADAQATLGQASVIDNGYEKVKEVEDATIEDLLKGQQNTNINPPAKETVKTQPVIDSSKKINVYAGNKDNVELSNFAKRPTTDPLGVTYNTVEGAFQAAKIKYATGDNSYIDKKLQTATGAQARALGNNEIKGLNVEAWDKNSTQILKSIMKDSFIENPEALKKLLATGNAQITHEFNGVEQDKGRFSKLLMEIRNELKNKDQKDPFTC